MHNKASTTKRTACSREIKQSAVFARSVRTDNGRRHCSAARNSRSPYIHTTDNNDMSHVHGVSLHKTMRSHEDVGEGDTLTNFQNFRRRISIHSRRIGNPVCVINYILKVAKVHLRYEIHFDILHRLLRFVSRTCQKFLRARLPQ